MINAEIFCASITTCIRANIDHGVGGFYCVHNANGIVVYNIFKCKTTAVLIVVAVLRLQ